MATNTSRIERKLQRLGKLPPDRIARLFERLGIEGERRIQDHCPMAVFLGAKVEDWVVRENDGTVHDTPESIVQFVGNFDRGMYPEITRPTATARCERAL